MRLSRAAAVTASALLSVTALAACAQEEAAPTPQASDGDACADITTVTDDALTAATSDPAFPPYVMKNDPANGKGFESAVAYAVAEAMGFTADQVTWTFAPFNKLFAPGEKDFDFALNQISILPAREQAVTFSDPYYNAANGVLVLKDSPYANATGLTDLQDAKIGVQVNTTGQLDVETLVQPSQQVAVFPNSTNATQALKNGQIDAFVTDTPTTIYLRDFVVDNSVVVGQFQGGTEWGLVLEKDTPLVACVNQAVQALVDDGTLDAITQQWMAPYTDVPTLS